jgi:hypothetical protein
MPGAVDAQRQSSLLAANVASAFGSGIDARAAGSAKREKRANSARRPRVTASAS